MPDQLKDGRSFVSRLRKVLAVRARYRIATSVQVDVPAVPNNALLAMVHLLDTGAMQVTALNFSQTTINETVTSEHLPTGAAVIDMFTDRTIATVDHTHSFPVTLEGHHGKSLLISPAPFADDDIEPLPAGLGRPSHDGANELAQTAQRAFGSGSPSALTDLIRFPDLTMRSERPPVDGLGVTLTACRVPSRNPSRVGCASRTCTSFRSRFPSVAVGRTVRSPSSGSARTVAARRTLRGWAGGSPDWAFPSSGHADLILVVLGRTPDRHRR